MSAFENAVRALARREGHRVADDEPVMAAMGEDYTGYSEFTVTTQWSVVEIRVGSYVRRFEDEEHARTNWMTGSKATLPALAQLWEALHPESGG